MTIEYLSDLSGISIRSIKEYNRVLEKNQLIYIFRQDDFLLSPDEKNISRMTNVYGRPADKLYIDSYAGSQKKEKKSYKWINSEVENANRKRSWPKCITRLQRVRVKNTLWKKFSRYMIIFILKIANIKLCIKRINTRST